MALKDKRVVIIAAIPVVVAGAFAFFDPIPQPQAYHDFADRRAFLGIANFADVASNLAFLASGLLGLQCCIRHRPEGACVAWLVFFAGVALVGFGSAWYHLAPGDGTLVWDRLAMTIGFMGAYGALLSEYVEPTLERKLLVALVLVGLVSVLYWVLRDDLRPYFAVQGTVFVSAAAMLLLFTDRFGQKPMLAIAFAFYGAAVVMEQVDHRVFALTGGLISGHTVKHLLAGVAPLWVYLMLRRRSLARDAAGT